MFFLFNLGAFAESRFLSYLHSNYFEAGMSCIVFVTFVASHLLSHTS
jgi:predicted Co/Zn/Cd cation transporter (cation efflux family)